MRTREQVIFDGQCYNLSLLIVQKEFLAQGRMSESAWKTCEVARLADELSKEVKNAITAFLSDRMGVAGAR